MERLKVERLVNYGKGTNSKKVVEILEDTIEMNVSEDMLIRDFVGLLVDYVPRILNEGR